MHGIYQICFKSSLLFQEVHGPLCEKKGFFKVLMELHYVEDGPEAKAYLSLFTRLKS